VLIARKATNSPFHRSGGGGDNREAGPAIEELAAMLRIVHVTSIFATLGIVGCVSYPPYQSGYGYYGYGSGYAAERAYPHHHDYAPAWRSFGWSGGERGGPPPRPHHDEHQEHRGGGWGSGWGGGWGGHDRGR